MIGRRSSQAERVTLGREVVVCGGGTPVGKRMSLPH